MKTHDFTATYQECIVSRVDAKTHRLKVTIPALEDLESDWLPMLTANAGGNQFYALPDVGELVIAILDAHGESGVVLGAIYNDVDTPPVADANMWVKKFNNGTIISHDRTSGAVVVQTSGAVTVTASSVTINAPSITLNGDVTVTGEMSVTGAVSVAQTVNAAGGVTGAGVSLSTHTHGGVESGGKRTSGPA